MTRFDSTSIQSSVTKTNTTRTFLPVLLQMVDAAAENIHQIYSLSAHVWKSLEDDLHVYSLSKLINPSLPINLLVPLLVWRQMCRTESDLLRSRPDVERIQNDSQHQPLTCTGRWLHIDFHGGVRYKTDGVIFFKLNYAMHHTNISICFCTVTGSEELLPVLGYHPAPMKRTASIASLKKQRYRSRRPVGHSSDHSRNQTHSILLVPHNGAVPCAWPAGVLLRSGPFSTLQPLSPGCPCPRCL